MITIVNVAHLLTVIGIKSRSNRKNHVIQSILGGSSCHYLFITLQTQTTLLESMQDNDNA